jgi:multicomponent Na+:H+ antiporter subunit E
MYLLLFFFWVILNGRITAEIVVLGLLFAAVVYAFAWKFMGLDWGKEKSFWKHFIWGVQYIAILLKEIAVANIAVLKIVLSPKKKVHPVIVSFDAPLKNHLLQVILANSITLTPGTITVRLYEEKFEVHCLDESMAEGLNDSVFVKMLKKLEET